MTKPAPPGLLRRETDPDVIMMVCTAGHVDHGKTALVRLLTGCETDKLREEKERGLTIELGFAPCMLKGGGLCVGIVDVPGHEKFVKNMVAGVSGIGMAILVIAADDGVMPQTVEHVQIMELLGVPRGIVALTKTDLVDAELLELVQEDVAEFLEGTFLKGAPICPVSSETGDGFFEFYDALVDTVQRLARTKKQGVFRMPVERVFVKKGFGTVITGIPIDGEVAVGDSVELVPIGETGKVRGIQRFTRNAESGGHGQCLALNLPDFSRATPERGQVAAAPGYLEAARIFQVRLSTVAGMEHPLRNAERVKFHTGTNEAPAKAYLLEHKQLTSNMDGYATIVTDDAIAAAPHDRFILRRSSPAVTVAGGEILFVTPGNARPRKRAVLKRLESYAAALGDAAPASGEGLRRRALWHFRHDYPHGTTRDRLAKTLLAPRRKVQVLLEDETEAGTLLALSGEEYVHAGAYADHLAQAAAHIDEVAGKGHTASIGTGELRAIFPWPQPLWDRVLAGLEEQGRVRVRGNKLVLAGFADTLSQSDRALLNRLKELYETSGFQSPRPAEAAEALQASPADVNRLMEHLYHQGGLVRLAKNVVLSYNTYRRAQDIVVRTVKEKGQLDSGGFKYEIDSTRKYALAILDFMDARRITVRTGNVRRLAPDYEKRLL